MRALRGQDVPGALRPKESAHSRFSNKTKPFAAGRQGEESAAARMGAGAADEVWRRFSRSCRPMA
ncbi:MAG: hypothetical protein DVB23_000239 [Verrucomicrobia bacterium]|nr:MAG: hypothetical protein DVB23_000239 [Verrucomicrobiota bacterium]